MVRTWNSLSESVDDEPAVWISGLHVVGGGLRDGGLRVMMVVAVSGAFRSGCSNLEVVHLIRLHPTQHGDGCDPAVYSKGFAALVCLFSFQALHGNLLSSA
ncbi:MAG: hypothetical protein U0930_02195 [Pirellulales bacterium]